MLQQNSRISRSLNVRTVFVWVALALLMSVGSAQAASIAPSDNAADRTTGLVWEFVFGDPVMGCVMPNGDLWVAPVQMAAQLEAATGIEPVERDLEDFVHDLPVASAGDAVRFQHGTPDADAIAALTNKGYTDPASVTPASGFDSAVEYSAP